MLNCGIYKIRNNVNGRTYIGCSKDIKSRWSQHKSKLNNSSHNNLALQEDWNIYGKAAFEFSILETCSESELKWKELQSINLYGEIIVLYNVHSVKDNIVYLVCSYFEQLGLPFYVDYSVKIDGKSYNFNMFVKTDEALFFLSLLNPLYDEEKTKNSRNLKLQYFDSLDGERKMVVMEYFPHYSYEYVNNCIVKKMTNFFEAA